MAAEASGSRPTSSIHGWENILPLNVRDDEIAIAKSSLTWTESTFSLIRNECYKVHWDLLQAREEIKQGRISPTAAAADLTEEKTRIEEQFLSRLDEKIPIQRWAKLTGQKLLAALEFTLLQDSVFHDYTPPSDRTGWQLYIIDR